MDAALFFLCAAVPPPRPTPRMRANADLVLSCPAAPHVALVPYTRAAVPTYHGWMEDAALRAATASERLTLADEHAMCDAWAADDDKLTFLIVSRRAGGEDGGHCGSLAPCFAPVGDVNLFFNDPNGDRSIAELEVMVAVPSARRGGVASCAIALVLAWAADALHVRRVVAKVGRDNAPSLALFQRLAFDDVGGSAVFNEAHRALDVGSVAGRALAARVDGWTATPVGEWVAVHGSWI